VQIDLICTPCRSRSPMATGLIRKAIDSAPS
jgi:protein-tyrosine-phosphatase